MIRTGSAESTFAARLLADLGAEVIKIEPPGKFTPGLALSPVRRRWVVLTSPAEAVGLVALGLFSPSMAHSPGFGAISAAGRMAFARKLFSIALATTAPARQPCILITKTRAG